MRFVFNTKYSKHGTYFEDTLYQCLQFFAERFALPLSKNQQKRNIQRVEFRQEISI